MTKSITPANRWAVLSANAVTGATGSDLILNEIDTGGCHNGTLVLTVNNAAGSDVANIQLWGSVLSDFATSGTQITAVTSDNTAICVLTSDASTAYSQGVLGASISDLTISSNKIANITEDGMYIFGVKGCNRYVNLQYDSDGPLSTIGAVFIGHDGPEVGPWTGAQAAY